MLRILAMSMVCLVLAACGRSPDEAVLRNDVQNMLASTFGEDTFTVVELVRRGSATDSTAPAGEVRKVAYYDVELELMRDLALGDWDEPGAATLVSLLGAGPRSISGVKGGGNVAGDRILANASAIYREVEGQWGFVMPAGFQESAPAVSESGPPASASRQALDRLAEITRTIEAGGMVSAQRVVDQELQRSVARIAGRLSRLEAGYPLAAGQDRGEYAAFASALAEIAKAQQLRILPVITGGSEENLALLRSGSVVVSLAQADTAGAAYIGSGVYAAQGGFPALKALGSLYPEYVHIVVRGENKAVDVGELKGAKIAMGPAGSAVRATVSRVMAAHGLQAGRDYVAVSLRFTEALGALRRGEVDAIAHVIGLPATPLRDALGGEEGLRLLPLADDAVQKLVNDKDGTLAGVISAGVYPGQAERVNTVAIPALLLATDDLSQEEAARLVRIVYQGANDLLAHGSTQGSQVSVRSARRGLTVPLHPGAEAALAELEGQ